MLLLREPDTYRRLVWQSFENVCPVHSVATLAAPLAGRTPWKSMYCQASCGPLSRICDLVAYRHRNIEGIKSLAITPAG